MGGYQLWEFDDFSAWREAKDLPMMILMARRQQNACNWEYADDMVP